MTTVPIQNPMLARFADEPTLVAEQSSVLFASLMTALVEHPEFANLLPAAAASADLDDYWTELGNYSAILRPYVVVDGVLQIPVKGVLLNDFPYTFFGYATGYDYIWRAFQRGMGDANVQGIALVIDSPGGMVAGCFDAADKALALKAEVGKPVRAYAAESAYSAAYVWACVADTITVSRTGGVGSIGVVTMHVDYSGALEQAGIKVTFIASDPTKTEGNAYEPLSADAKARTQARIDELYAIFVDHVVATRGLTEDTIRGTLKALCYSATEAKSNGLSDAIGALDDALAEFAADLSNLENDGDSQMSTQDNSAASNPAEQPIAAAPQVDVAAVSADARTNERQRIAAITGCDEAQGRSALASHLALNTDMSVEDAKGILAAAAAESAPQAAAPAEAPTPFATHMDNSAQPNVGAGAAAQNDDPDDASSVVALASRMGLKGFAKRA